MTIVEVFDTMNDEQKQTSYSLIMFALDNGIKPYLILNYDNGDESRSHTHILWPVFKTFNELQKKAVSLMIDCALKGE